MTLTNPFDETGLIKCSIVPPANVSSSVLLLISHLGVTFTTFTLTFTSLIHGGGGVIIGLKSIEIDIGQY